jgi:hypothetical protein
MLFLKVLTHGLIGQRPATLGMLVEHITVPMFLGSPTLYWTIKKLAYIVWWMAWSITVIWTYCGLLLLFLQKDSHLRVFPQRREYRTTQSERLPNKEKHCNQPKPALVAASMFTSSNEHLSAILLETGYHPIMVQYDFLRSQGPNVDPSSAEQRKNTLGYSPIMFCEEINFRRSPSVSICSNYTPVVATY